MLRAGVRGALGWPMAVASSSNNANRMMQPIRLALGQSLLDVFSANVCGRDLRQGKPNPEIFLLAAAELRVTSAHCLVVEDSPAGIEAARAGRMTSLGVARLGDAALLRAAGAGSGSDQRFDNLGATVEARIQSDEYLSLVRKAFRIWDEADTQEKRRYPECALTMSSGYS